MAARQVGGAAQREACASAREFLCVFRRCVCRCSAGQCVPCKRRSVCLWGVHIPYAGEEGGDHRPGFQPWGAGAWRIARVPGVCPYPTLHPTSRSLSGTPTPTLPTSRSSGQVGVPSLDALVSNPVPFPALHPLIPTPFWVPSLLPIPHPKDLEKEAKRVLFLTLLRGRTGALFLGCGLGCGVRSRGRVGRSGEILKRVDPGFL